MMLHAETKQLWQKSICYRKYQLNIAQQSDLVIKYIHKHPCRSLLYYSIHNLPFRASSCDLRASLSERVLKRLDEYLYMRGL